MSTTYQIAVDIGGTFTDGVMLAESVGNLPQIYVAKALTTPRSPGDAIATVTEALLAQRQAQPNTRAAYYTAPR